MLVYLSSIKRRKHLISLYLLYLAARSEVVLLRAIKDFICNELVFFRPCNQKRSQIYHIETYSSF